MKHKGSLFLLLTALLWGSGFVAQRNGMDYVGPFTFVFCRYLIAVISLLCLIVLGGRGRKLSREDWVRSVRAGLICGIPLAAGMILQQVGLVESSASKAAFLTSTYIVMVPVLELLLGNRIRPKEIVAVFIAVIGFYFLSVKGDFRIEKSDLTVLLAALSFAVQIILIDRFAKEADPLVQSCATEVLTCITAFVLMMRYESFSLSNVRASILPILYCAILCGSAADTLQVIGQRSTPSSLASLIMSLESVFGALFGVLLLKERMSVREILGCILIFAAVIYPHLNKKEKQH